MGNWIDKSPALHSFSIRNNCLFRFPACCIPITKHPIAPTQDAIVWGIVTDKSGVTSGIVVGMPIALFVPPLNSVINDGRHIRNNVPMSAKLMRNGSL